MLYAQKMNVGQATRNDVRVINMPFAGAAAPTPGQIVKCDTGGNVSVVADAADVAYGVAMHGGSEKHVPVCTEGHVLASFTGVTPTAGAAYYSGGVIVVGQFSVDGGTAYEVKVR